MNIEKIKRGASIHKVYTYEGLSSTDVTDFIEANHQQIMKERYKVSVKLSRSGQDFTGSYLGNDVLISVMEGKVELWVKLSFVLKPAKAKVESELSNLANELLRRSKDIYGK